mmetsp:Transcript_14390/g.37878  ORF Transcript_14390/g.37878 Transcript_14390/m.37878 type:complete len:214 (-) Transcript_14390:136-777(-)
MPEPHPQVQRGRRWLWGHRGHDGGHDGADDDDEPPCQRDVGPRDGAGWHGQPCRDGQVEEWLDLHAGHQGHAPRGTPRHGAGHVQGPGQGKEGEEGEEGSAALAQGARARHAGPLRARRPVPEPPFRVRRRGVRVAADGGRGRGAWDLHALQPAALAEPPRDAGPQRARPLASDRAGGLRQWPCRRWAYRAVHDATVRPGGDGRRGHWHEHGR